ncbi:DUF1033 family protein [Paenisporosarcina cavernae]|uniref:DUF1033 family protein n=1 Tax=Paenisporosarcina cavernae TaxID=2320858 RepID=A0A385YRU6_9BACL|nr:DUF1033 family protein [Paenisporosarcina cavernae]AYC29469.1 DUF1033 family protein [Paenisporosarcina cavernae]
MYQLIYMKADYEPWWMFEGWEEYIVQTETFDNIDDAMNGLVLKVKEFSQKYPHLKTKDDTFWSFWSDEEIVFCDACDDDLQTYHGIICMKEGKATPFKSE